MIGSMSSADEDMNNDGSDGSVDNSDQATGAGESSQGDASSESVVLAESDDTEQPVELVAPGTFTIERAAGFDHDDQSYLSDILFGMLETNRTNLVLRREDPLPYFGFLHARPLACDYEGIVRFIGHMIDISEDKIAWGGEGTLKTHVCEDDFPVEILFGVEIGPRASWVCLSRDVETRVLTKQPPPPSM